MAARERTRVLVADDAVASLEVCRCALQEAGCTFRVERDPAAARSAALSGEYAIALVAPHLAGVPGLDIAAAAREQRSDLQVILLIEDPSGLTVREALQHGAADVLLKPFTAAELRARIAVVSARAAQCRAAVASVSDAHPGPGLVWRSMEMARVQALISKVAPTDATVLIVGESGTGKELVALEIHRASRRRETPLVSLDCSALAPGLLESELFGHVKGSFTGAVTSKPGLFEVAHGGTLFLDEVASLAPETQGKLLRVLEAGEIKPVGGVQVARVDIRLMAATNRDLGELVEARTFREDLFYRLNVVPIRLPPLRERPDDILPLLNHFLGKLRVDRPGAPHGFSDNALDALVRYPWPGNVRELRNLVERLVVTTDEETIRLKHLPPQVAHREDLSPAVAPRHNEELKAMKRRLRAELARDLERAFVLQALDRSGWNVTRAAKETGIARPNFHALMRKHHIRAREMAKV